MSLFPAYAQGNIEPQECIQIRDIVVNEKSASPTLELEASLLASDEEEPRPEAPSEAAGRPRTPPPPDCDFYWDRARDTGNLRVSTLYYPGRPNYSWRDEGALGGGVRSGVGRRRRRAKRYYEAAAAPATPLHDEAAARAAAYRRLLADAPNDVDLWLRLIHFQEVCVGAGAALETAQEATSRAPRSAALRAAYHRLARVHLPRPDYLAKLRDMIATEKHPPTRSWLWVQLIRALASSSAECSADSLAAAARAATHDMRHYAPAYAEILREYGLFLRAGGLWELLVLLIELVGSMSFPASVTFPPAHAEGAEGELVLQRAEDAISGSGLPLAARWARLERVRAAAHWRPATSADQMQLDPQRAPLGSDVSELLQPCAPAQALHLCCTLLQLAKVPMLPGTGALHARTECFEGALPVILAARRLPPAHPARAPPALTAAAAAMLVDPPHYLTPQSGFQAWVDALWDACCGWLQGSERVALLCWRLRWLHALLLLQPQGSPEARRIRQSARASLRSFGGSMPLPFAHFARIEALVNGTQAGVKAAWLSARAAARDPSCAAPTRLYCARALLELAGGVGGAGGAGGALWALAGAALGEAPPERADGPPPAGLLEEALQRCEHECQKLEEEFSCSTGDDADRYDPAGLLSALLPGAGEWAAARVLLAPPARHAHIYKHALAHPPNADCSWAAQRYWEQQACALAGAAHARGQGAATARALAAYAPHSAYLAVASGGAPLWAGRSANAESTADGWQESEVRAWGALLPALLPALGTDAAAHWRRAAAAANRHTAAGAALATAALELGARAPAAATERVLYDALDHQPHHKWLYVRGSCWSPSGASLADLLLDRQLRLHALPMELPDADTDANAP